MTNIFNFWAGDGWGKLPELLNNFVNNNENDLTQIKLDIATLQNGVTGLQQAVDDLNSNLSIQTQYVADLQTGAANASQAIQDLWSAVNNLQN